MESGTPFLDQFVEQTNIRYGKIKGGVIYKSVIGSSRQMDSGSASV